MNTPNSVPLRKIRAGFVRTVVMLAVLGSAPFACLAVNDYFSLLNPPGSGYDQNGNYWNATSETSTPLAANVIGDLMVIGASAGDFNGSNYTINLDNGGSMSGGGINIGATNTIITFIGTANTHGGAAEVYTVAAGSELIMDVTHDGGYNNNNEALTFNGGGIIDFEDLLGANDSALLTENMTGAGTLIAGYTSVNSFGTPSGGFTLTAGAFDIGTAFTAGTLFTNFGSGKVFAINGGSIDNTSGSGVVLSFGNNVNTGPYKYSIGGNFTFTGSSSLDFGVALVTNTANHTITVQANTLAIGGPILGPGIGLGKAGAGTLLLYGASTYTGPTVVEGGTLALTNAGSLASGTQILVSNATFDVSGLSGNYTGTAPIGMNGGTFNLTNLLATAVSSLSLTNSTLSVAAVPSTETNINTSILTGAGTTNLVDITFIPLVTGYPRTFHIINAGTVTGTLNFGLGTLPTVAAYSGYITNRANGVDFVLTGGPTPVFPLVWTGVDANTDLPSGNWDVGMTEDWNATGIGPSTFGQLDLVTFNDTATGPTTIEIAGGLTPGSLTVSNNALSYVFTEANLSDGLSPLTLVKQGPGLLTLQENGDNFSGGLSVSGGTLIVDNNSSSISGGATVGAGGTMQLGNNDANDYLPSGTITVNGTLSFNQSDTPYINNTIAGSGLVEQTGTNTVELAGTSSGNWSALIENGTLQPANDASLGSLPGGTVTITNGGTLDIGLNTTENTVNFGAKQFNIAGGGVGGNGVIVNSSGSEQLDAFQNIVLTTNATIGGVSRWDIRNGSPVLNLGGYTLTKTNVNHVAVVSAHVTSGNILIQQGTLSFEVTPSFDASAGTITVNSGAVVAEYENTLGSFTRSIVLNGGTNQNLAGAGTTTYLDAPILLETSSTFLSTGGLEYFDGAISDGGAGYGIIVTGTGTNLFAGTNTYRGPTIVAQGVVGLTNYGSIFVSPLIYVTNDATFTVADLAVPFSGTNALVVGDDTFGSGNLVLGSTIITNFNYLSLSNASIQLAVDAYGAPEVTVTNLNLGDGGASSYITITALPQVPIAVPAQIPLIKYANVSGTYNLNLSSYPGGYSMSLVNDPASNSIDLLITGVPAGFWNGGDSAVDNNWSDPINWDGAGLSGSDNLTFTGVTGLINTNDTGNETAQSITFVPGAGRFDLNGNPVTLAAGITNNSTSLQTINLGLDVNLNAGTNLTINAGTAGLNIPGGITNISSTWYILHLQGTNGTLGSVQSTASPYNLAITLDNVGATNTWSMIGNNTVSALTNLTVSTGGNFTFGTGSDSPTLAITNNAAGAITLGNVTNTASTFTMNSGTLALTNYNNASLDIGTVGAKGTFNMNGGNLYLAGKYLMIGDSGSTGIFNQTGGTVTTAITGDVILGNSISNSSGTVNLSGGTFNATANNDFFVALRGVGTWNISGTGLLELQTLNIARNSTDSAGASGTLNLNGGTVIMNGESMGNIGSNQVGAINFNGGLLQAGAASASFISVPALPSVLTNTVKVGGAVINDGGFAITISSPLIHDSTLGTGTDGGLLKSGSGTLTLSATNTYNGITTVSNGTLTVSGVLGTNAVNVLAGGTLSGSGIVSGNVSVTGTIAPGTPAVAATLTSLGNVTVNASGTAALKLDLNNNTNDNVSVAGTVTYGGTLTVTLLSGTPAGNESFQLFKAGAYSGHFTATNLPALGSGQIWVWTPANGTLSLVTTVIIPNVPPQVSGLSLAGSNVSINATNGVNGGTYYLLSTTNLAVPVSHWTPVATNVITASGGSESFTFIGTNAATAPVQFYILSNTNF